MNSRFQVATHILTLLNKMEGEVVSSDFIAASVNANPVLIRKELSNLKKHGLVESKEGKAGGYVLAKPAVKITMAHIYETVKGLSPFGVSKNTANPDCPVGKQINGHIKVLFNDIDETIIKRLSCTTLADFGKNFK